MSKIKVNINCDSDKSNASFQDPIGRFDSWNRLREYLNLNLPIGLVFFSTIDTLISEYESPLPTAVQSWFDKNSKEYRTGFLEKNYLQPYIEYDSNLEIDTKSQHRPPKTLDRSTISSFIPKSRTQFRTQHYTGLYGTQNKIRVFFPKLNFKIGSKAQDFAVLNGQELLIKFSLLEKQALGNAVVNLGVTRLNGYQDNINLPLSISAAFTEQSTNFKQKIRPVLQINGLKIKTKVWTCDENDFCYIYLPFSNFYDADSSEENFCPIYYSIGVFDQTLYFIPRYDLAQGTTATLTPVIQDGKIISIDITDPGSSYDNTKLPKISIVDNAGSGAKAICEVSADGKIKKIIIGPNDQGENYSENTTVTIEAPPEKPDKVVYNKVLREDKTVIYLANPNDNTFLNLYNNLNMNNSFSWLPDTYPYYDNVKEEKTYSDFLSSYILEYIQSIVFSDNAKNLQTKKFLEQYILKYCDSLAENDTINICFEQIGLFTKNNEPIESEDDMSDLKDPDKNDSELAGESIIFMSTEQLNTAIKNNLVINRKIEGVYTK